MCGLRATYRIIRRVHSTTYRPGSIVVLVLTPLRLCQVDTCVGTRYYRISNITANDLDGRVVEVTSPEGDGGAAAPPALRTPSPEALKVAALIKDRLGRRVSAPVRIAFIGAHGDDREAGTVPPLARILRGGRGGEVRVKLELTFLWFAVNPPHDLTYPARAWALLLDLDDPETGGTRRVRQAINALNAADLIAVATRPGQPSRITLLDEGGRGVAYVPPGQAFAKARNTPDEWRHRYIQLPDAFWTNGWITVLSGAAVAMLLVLFAERGSKPATQDLWFSPKRAVQLYGLSEDTRAKGLRELRAAGLVSARKRSASRDALDFRRLRNTYRIEDNRFAESAAVPATPEPAPPLPPSDAALGDLFQSLLDDKRARSATNAGREAPAAPDPPRTQSPFFGRFSDPILQAAVEKGWAAQQGGA